ncbi:hypothetical protein J437_LFUL005478 [Ladona fulva]|uniref:Mediator of RNA polymerase II transcription subunit 13 n=1 Tax=Ladona fulva TaxID=123851 RepID=A0A8K0JXX1_LADFU|nr:hypothetical protein J437_LFUL005478 [Ladona fulva]
MDGQTQRLLEEWRQFYPIDAKYFSREMGAEGHSLPPAVEVLVGGVRMRYPSCYVLLTDMDDMPSLHPHLGMVPPCGAVSANPSVSKTAVATSVGANTGCRAPHHHMSTHHNGHHHHRHHHHHHHHHGMSSPSHVMAAAQHSLLLMGAGAAGAGSGLGVGDVGEGDCAAYALPEYVWRDAILNPLENLTVQSESSRPSECAERPPASQEPGHWSFADPTRKAVCTCVK